MYLSSPPYQFDCRILKPISDYRLRLRLDWNLTNQKKENQSQV